MLEATGQSDCPTEAPRPFAALRHPVDVFRLPFGCQPPRWLNRQLMALPLADRYHAKQGRSTAAWVTPDSGRRVFVKRHYRFPLSIRALAVAAPQRAWSPAFREWSGLLLAACAGVRVPAPVAAAQFVGPGLRLQSVLVVEELHGYLPAHEWLVEARSRLSLERWHDLAEQLMAAAGRTAARLHRARLFHKDLYLCHFFVPETRLAHGWIAPADIVLIDFHRLSRHRTGYLHWLIKDLAQLLYSAREAGVPGHAIERFFDTYWPAAGWPASSRPVLRYLAERKARRYWAHNEKHGTLWRPPDLAKDAA